MFLNSDNITKKLRINNIILYDENENKIIKQFEARQICGYDEKTTIKKYNEIYNNYYDCIIFDINSIYIKDIKKKNKIDYKEKNAYYIILKNDKIWNEFLIDLFLNKNYFESIQIKENAKKQEMRKGYFYVHDNIKIQFKNNITFNYSDSEFIYFKDLKSGLDAWYAFNDLEEIENDIKEKEETLFKSKDNYKKYIAYMNNKIKAGFLYRAFKHFESSVTADKIKVDFNIYTHTETSPEYKKIEMFSKYIKERPGLRLDIDPSSLIELFNILKIDINKLDLKFLEAVKNG